MKLLVPILIAALAVAGCDSPARPIDRAAAPTPDSPTKLLSLYRWCWVNRDFGEYQNLFTEDYVRVASDGQTYGRDDELALAQRLVRDSGRIEFTFVNEPLIPIADPRPGKQDPSHRVIQTRVTVHGAVADSSYLIDGDIAFFVVRGDSALIPPEMQERGFGPDPNRWYIERRENKTDATDFHATR